MMKIFVTRLVVDFKRRKKQLGSRWFRKQNYEQETDEFWDNRGMIVKNSSIGTQVDSIFQSPF